MYKRFVEHRVEEALSDTPVVLITGPRRAGKTTLVQSIAAAWGYQREATSPTFALVHEYHAPKSPVFHLDLYRLETPQQIVAAGLEEYLQCTLTSVGGGSNNNWAVQNVPMYFNSLGDLNGGELPSTIQFDLGPRRQTAVSVLGIKNVAVFCE